MEKYLYFAEGGGANATTEAGLYPASRFLGVEPISATTTGIYFDSPMGDVDHADTHDTAGSYHRSKLIAKACAQAINAGPHADGGVITVIDMDTGVHFGEIDTIKGDASFGIVITLDS